MPTDSKSIRDRIMEKVKSIAPAETKPETLDSLVDQLSKATQASVREILNEIPIHEDLFYDNNQNSNPSSNVIRMGPKESASGDGAEHMIRQYSNVAPQGDGTISELYGRFSRELDSLRKALSTDVTGLMKTNAALIKAVSLLSESFRVQNAVLGAILKAEKEEEEEEEEMKKKAKKAEEEEEEEEEESEKAKALKYAKKAKTLILKAEVSDLEETANPDELISKAASFLKKATSLLMKALEETTSESEETSIEKSLEDVKKLSSRLSKAKDFVASLKKADEEEEDEEEEDEEEEEEAAVVNINQGAEEEEDEEEEDEEEEKAKKSSKKPSRKSKKAKRPAPGNQKDSANKDGNQKDGAVKASDLPGLVASISKRTVSELMDIIGNQSRGKVAPNLSKATLESFLISKAQAIEEAVANEEMTDMEASTAESILNMFTLVHQNEISQDLVTERLSVAPTSVQRIFNFDRV